MGTVIQVCSNAVVGAFPIGTKSLDTESVRENVFGETLHAMDLALMVGFFVIHVACKSISNVALPYSMPLDLMLEEIHIETVMEHASTKLSNVRVSVLQDQKNVEIVVLRMIAGCPVTSKHVATGVFTSIINVMENVLLDMNHAEIINAF